MEESNNFLAAADIRSAWAGTIVYPPGGRYGPRIQPDLQLVLLHTGRMAVEIDGSEYTVQPGHVALLQPGHLETFRFSESLETWHRWIAVHLDPIREQTADFMQSLPFALPISEAMNRLTDLMLLLQADLPAESEVLRSLGKSALELYAYEINRERERQGPHPSVLAAKRAIHQRYEEDLTLERLAGDVGVSPEHLIRLFRASESTTPIKYLWHYRVLKAQEMLTYTGLSITEIAARCGFKTTYHFARVLKQQTGRTPSELRMASWQGHANEPRGFVVKDGIENR